MTLLEKHRGDYLTLSKSELIKIIEEQLARNGKRNSRQIYNPLNSKWNNLRRAIRRDWNRRKNKEVRDRIREKAKLLRGISKEDRKTGWVKTKDLQKEGSEA